MQSVGLTTDIKLYKIVIAGETNVGKTSLRMRYFGEKFTKSYIPTLGVDFSVKRLKLDQSTFAEIQVWDMAGQMTFQALRKRFFLGASSIFLVFDIKDKESFVKLREWFDDFWVSFNNRKDIPVVLVGNKIDLGDPVVSKEEMDQFWENIKKDYPDFTGKYETVLTSALNGENVQELFDSTIHHIFELYRN